MSGFTDDRTGLVYDDMSTDHLLSGGGNDMTGGLRFAKTTHKLIMLEGEVGEGQIWPGDQSELWFYKPSAGGTEYVKWLKESGLAVVDGATEGAFSSSNVGTIVGGGGGGDALHTHP